MPPRPAMVRTVGLTKRYGPVTAVDNLSVEMPPGVVGLVGANGAGKSTLIKILLGLLGPHRGGGPVLGLDVSTEGQSIRERVGYMPEHDCLPPDVTATGFVVHMARMSGLPAAAARERAADTLRLVGLYEERYRLIGAVLHGHAATGQAGPGPGRRPGPDAARRAHQRARPRGPRRDARPGPPRRHRAGHLDPGHLPPARASWSGSATTSWSSTAAGCCARPRWPTPPPTRQILAVEVTDGAEALAGRAAREPASKPSGDGPILEVVSSRDEQRLRRRARRGRRPRGRAGPHAAPPAPTGRDLLHRPRDRSGTAMSSLSRGPAVSSSTSATGTSTAPGWTVDGSGSRSTRQPARGLRPRDGRRGPRSCRSGCWRWPWFPRWSSWRSSPASSASMTLPVGLPGIPDRDNHPGRALYVAGAGSGRASPGTCASAPSRSTSPARWVASPTSAPSTPPWPRRSWCSPRSRCSPSTWAHCSPRCRFWEQTRGLLVGARRCGAASLWSSPGSPWSSRR